MGRLEYLNRLSLGLSAFHPLQTHIQSRDGRAGALNVVSPGCDDKGRPRNPRAAEHHAAQRYAENEVLELANIVERIRQNDTQFSNVPDWPHGSPEHAHVALLADGVRLLLTWYPQNLLGRSLLGIYGPETSFAQILARDMASFESSSLVGGLTGLWSGVGLYITYAVLTTLCNNGVELLSIELPSLIDPIDHDAIIINIRTALASLPPLFELCLMPVLQLALISRLDLVRPRGLFHSLSMLVGYLRLSSERARHLDRSLLPTFLALPLLLGSSQDHRHGFMHWASHPRQQSSAISVHTHWRLSPVMRAFRQVILAFPSLCNIEDNFADLSLEAPKTTAGKTCREDQGPQAKADSLVESMSLTVLRRLMQLPLDWVIIQLSGRAFNMIVGPLDHSGLMDLPTYHIADASSILDTGLAHASKVGLALGLSLAVETTVQIAASATMRNSIHSKRGHCNNRR